MRRARLPTDAEMRVCCSSLAFMATGGFLGLHALGTAGVLFTKEYAGFMVAIPVGLLVSAAFAGASAFVDVRPEIGAFLIRRRTLLRAAVLTANDRLAAVHTHAHSRPLRMLLGRLPDGAIVEERPGLRIKGKEGAFRAYVLLALP
jgi:hypothetical protein